MAEKNTAAKSGKNSKKEKTFIEKRKNVMDRRVGLDRRRGPGRRRSPERICAEEGHMTDEQFEFVMAVDKYKKQNQRPFPSWTEILEIIKVLGYRKVAEPGSLDYTHGEQEAKEPAEVG